MIDRLKAFAGRFVGDAKLLVGDRAEQTDGKLQNAADSSKEILSH
ncbi:MAG: hypothetical protein P4L83_15100 [Nevskia sp.]|nr:hypothetical protein [Nevskia sp.]